MSLSAGVLGRFLKIDWMQWNPLENINQINTSNKCPRVIKAAIVNSRAVAVGDTSIDERHVVVAWVITTLDNVPRSYGDISSMQ